MSCPLCDDIGAVPYARNDVTYVARCVCPAGFQLSSMLPRADTVYTKAELKTRGWDGLVAVRTIDWATVGMPPKFHTWELSTSPRAPGSRSVQTILKWAKVTASRKRSDLLLFGTPGTGKTGLLVGALKEIARRGERIRFVDVQELLHELRAAFGETRQTEMDRLRPFLHVETLAIDDLTAVRNTEYYRDTLHFIIDQRQKFDRPTAMTLNLDTEDELKAFFGGPLYDRVRSRAVMLHLKGESYRETREGVEQP